MASTRAALSLVHSNIRIAVRQPRQVIVRRFAAAASQSDYESSTSYAAWAGAVALLSASSAAYSVSMHGCMDEHPLTVSFQQFRKNLRIAQSQQPSSRVTVDWEAPPLGVGAFASVHLAYDNNEPVALKRINKAKTNKVDFAREVHSLLQIQRHSGHPHVMKLRDMYEDDNYYYLVMDYAKGGEVFEDLITNGAYSQAEAARVIHQLAQALDFLHNKVGMVHADLKPENLLLTREDRSQMILVDFGCAAPAAATVCHGSGTTAYASPERLVEAEPAVTPAMDMWSVGIILYMLLSETHPFDPTATASDKEVQEAVCSATASPTLDGVPAAVQDLLDGLLAVDPQKRMTAAELVQHPWILQHVQGSQQEEAQVKSPKQGVRSTAAGLLSSLGMQTKIFE